MKTKVYESLEKAINAMLESISGEIPNRHRKKPVNLHITGGIAIYFHTASRVSKDLDAILDRRVDIPKKLSFLWQGENGEIEELDYDHNYTSSLGIMHEDYEDRAIHQFTIDKKLNVFILSPVDLIISKLSRFGEQDQEDIKSIIKNDLVSKKELIELATDAIGVSVSGRPETLKINLGIALEMFDDGSE